MKFTDGNWMLQPGVRTYHPDEVAPVETDSVSLNLYLSTRPIRHQGDTVTAEGFGGTLTAHG